MTRKAVYAATVATSWILAGIVLTGIASGHPLSKHDQIAWVIIAMIWAGNALIQAIRRDK